MKIAMIPYTGKRLAAEYACRSIERLDEFDCTYTVPENFRSLIKSGRAEYFTTEFETVKNADMAIAIGGDGTIILDVLQLPGKKAIPAKDILNGHRDLFRPGRIIE